MKFAIVGVCLVILVAVHGLPYPEPGAGRDVVVRKATSSTTSQSSQKTSLNSNSQSTILKKADGTYSTQTSGKSTDNNASKSQTDKKATNSVTDKNGTTNNVDISSDKYNSNSQFDDSYKNIKDNDKTTSEVLAKSLNSDSRETTGYIKKGGDVQTAASTRKGSQNDQYTARGRSDANGSKIDVEAARISNVGSTDTKLNRTGSYAKAEQVSQTDLYANNNQADKHGSSSKTQNVSSLSNNTAESQTTDEGSKSNARQINDNKALNSNEETRGGLTASSGQLTETQQDLKTENNDGTVTINQNNALNQGANSGTGSLNTNQGNQAITSVKTTRDGATASVAQAGNANQNSRTDDGSVSQGISNAQTTGSDVTRNSLGTSNSNENSNERTLTSTKTVKSGDWPVENKKNKAPELTSTQTGTHTQQDDKGNIQTSENKQVNTIKLEPVDDDDDDEGYDDSQDDKTPDGKYYVDHIVY